MCGEKCRRPCLYTRSKSECFSRCAARGNRFRLDIPDGSTHPRRTSPTSSPFCTSLSCRCLVPLLWQLYTGNWQLLDGEKLLSETRLHRDALASFGPAARQHLSSALGLHSG